MRKNTVYALLTWILIIIVLLLFGFFRNNALAKAECPEKVLGNQEAEFSIKYFESPFCIYCWFEEPIIKDLVAQKGDLFSIAYYDVRYCHKDVATYNVPGTPTFVFSIDNEEYVKYGFIPKQDLLEIICQGSGGC